MRSWRCCVERHGMNKTPPQPRGIRNHNPFNIRHGASRWQGLAEEQPDEAFCSFVHPTWGIRAGMRLLRTYQLRYGLWKLCAMLERFAPPHENNTAAYVNAVAVAMGVAVDAVVDLVNPEVAYKLATAIIKHENGQQPYAPDVVRKGIALANLSKEA